MISAVLQVKRNLKRDEFEYCVSVCEGGGVGAFFDMAITTNWSKN